MEARGLRNFPILGYNMADFRKRPPRVSERDERELHTIQMLSPLFHPLGFGHPVVVLVEHVLTDIGTV